MTFLSVILLLIVVIYIAFRVIRAAYSPRTSQDEVHYVIAPDGWRIALHRYLPRGENRHGEPVLIHHGLAGTHVNFDLGVGTPEKPVPSLAHWLADRGYDAWVCDLRGRGFSERPGLFNNRRYDWSVDDFIEKDDPAFVDYILGRTGFKSMHWVGLSMGGVLLLCYCGLHGSDKIASGVALGSGLNYRDTGSGYESAIRFARLAPKIRRVPLGFLGALEAPLLGRGWNLRLERFNFHPSNVSPRAQRAFNSGSLVDVSGKMLLQMSKLFDPEGMTSMDGRVRYAELAKNITTPILMVAGDRDMQSTPECVRKTFEMLTGDQHKMITIGKEHGQADHYGHVDLVAGLRADQETFPEILKWLKEHPANK